ncbi:MAG: YjbH domain-containing protein [Rubellimicrobium sp.]|nr:YjbH domain-containing protein [Rubellimicrobium sp.]
MNLRRTLALGSAMVALAAPALAQDRGLTYSLYGTPGLIDLPSAMAANDGQIAGTLALSQGESRTAFTFQMSPRLSGTFRYSSLQDYDAGSYYGRGLDLRYQLMDEDGWRPALAVGLQDFLQDSPYSGEYVVATSTIGDSFRVTAGLGWGRLGDYAGLADRLAAPSDGAVPADHWFRGTPALFGGIEWAPNERFLFKAEYDGSDGYRAADGTPLLDNRSPLNFGVTWRPKPGYQVGLAVLHGSEVALSGTLLFNPHDRPYAMGLDSAPVPVAVRGVAAAASWDRPAADLRTAITAALAADGFRVDSVELTDRAARIRYTNGTYRAEAQGLGRVARILTTLLPPGIETITLEPMRQGIALSAVTFRRSDLETLENAPGGTRAIFDRATFADAGGRAGLVAVPQDASRLSWGIAPYGSVAFFRGRDPISLDFGLQASARYSFAPNLVLSGAVRYSLISHDLPGSISSGPVQPVRRLSSLYSAEGNPGITNLQLTWYSRPGHNLYSRVSLGYFETMFGGVSTELLYSPVDTRWAIGAELNYVAQRANDGGLGFGGYCEAGGHDYCDPSDDHDYRTLTGHLSLYYGLSDQLQAQVDVGRYLAGEWGATVALDREFGNGWRIGGQVTVTDAHGLAGQDDYSAGIRISMPADFLYGTPSRGRSGASLGLYSGDAGSRLGVSGRLYDFVREGQVPDLETGWGRFWR